MQELKTNLEQRLTRMKDYLLLKYEENDWHGVADAAMDIREIVAKLEVINTPLVLSKVETFDEKVGGFQQYPFNKNNN